MPVPRETVVEVIETYHQAAELNGAHSQRIGHIIHLGAEHGEDVMVTADLHGHRMNYLKILEKCQLAEFPQRHLILQEVCHGGPTYPETNGCMSHTMLEDVAKLIIQFPGRVHFLLSNHELAELTDFPITKSKRMLNLSFRCGMQEMYGPQCDQVRDAMMAFLRSCPLAVHMQNGAFVCHSAPESLHQRPFDVGVFERPWEESDLAPGGDVFRLVWGRDFRAENGSEFARMVKSKVLIHGHEPCLAGFDVPNPYQIILDCSDENACCVLLPLAGELDQQAVVDSIEFLHRKSDEP